MSLALRPTFALFLINETIFDLRECPDHVVVIGGGPIGIMAMGDTWLVS
jgi:pyruvate/2-oxoglutarate dehydrogenase complex dihydrolipoamide dehydrogenase (E3) component